MTRENVIFDWVLTFYQVLEILRRVRSLHFSSSETVGIYWLLMPSLGNYIVLMGYSVHMTVQTSYKSIGF